MGRLGFGFGANPRVGITPIPGQLVPVLAPSAGFTGVAGSGYGGSYGTVPADPPRTTAKPALRLLTPERQWFTDQLLVGVMAMANNGGTMIDNLGLEKVICHFEGRSVDIATPTFQTFPDVNGKPVTYLGWWCRLQHGGIHGHGRVYFEAVPKDPTMQRRVLGPFTFSPQASKYDLEVEIAPSAPEVTGVRYKTLMAGILYAKNQNKINPRFRITESGDYNITDSSSGGTKWNVPGYYNIEATVPARIARPGPYTTDTAGMMIPPRVPLCFRGANLTIDFANIYQINSAAGIAGLHWCDGVEMYCGAPGGRYALRRGQVHNTTNYGRILGLPYFTECYIHDTTVACTSTSLVRGCRVERISQDMISGSYCVVDSTFDDHDNTIFNTSVPSFTVAYSGPEATATLARSGGTEGSGSGGGIYTARWGANSATFQVGSTEGYYTGALGNGYWFRDVVAWLNTLPGFTATLLDDTIYACTGSLPGLKGQGFGATDCKTAPLAVVSYTDKHGDWYQHGADYFENVIVWGNKVTRANAQFIFLCPISNADGSDMFFINNSCDHLTGFSAFSQLGRTNVAHSHIVIAHNTMSNQGILLRRDNTGYDLDSYCLLANNSLQSFSWSANNVDPSATVKGLHLHTGAPVPAGSTGVTTGGDRLALYVAASTGNFTPAGALLANPKAPVVKYDQRQVQRAIADVAGALAA